MAIEVSYIIITPRTLLKSRTGGIIARLMSRADLDLIGAQVLAFTPEAAGQYAQSLEAAEPGETGKLLADYVRENFPPRENGRKERTLMLLFRGEDACRKLTEITGRLPLGSAESGGCGGTLRDTYADVVADRENPAVIRYFEPAVLTPPNRQAAGKTLPLLAGLAASAPNIIDDSRGSAPGDERTLVILKPDNWRCASSRPGAILDMLSRTGLRIVGCKVFHMSVDDALKFYAPVQNALRGKLASKIAGQAKAFFEEKFGFALPESSIEALTRSVGVPFADDQFSQLIEFMSGRRPDTESGKAQQRQSAAKCFALIYEGPDAIAKIRSVLGPTDPAKAPGGTVRRDFGSSVMVNSAHASDAPESVERETGIIRMAENSMVFLIREYIEGAEH